MSGQKPISKFKAGQVSAAVFENEIPVKGGKATVLKATVKKMNQLVRTTLNLEQYQCRSCGRFFYINAIDRSSLDLDFGCPFGCDDNGRHIRDIKTEINHVDEIAGRD